MFDALLVMVGVDDVDEVVFWGTSVVMPAGLVFRRTFFVLGNLLSFLYFIRRFWNQIFTWVSVSLSEAENSARSAIDKYCF